MRKRHIGSDFSIILCRLPSYGQDYGNRNHHRWETRLESVTGIKEILLQDKAADLRQMWENEVEFTTNRVKGYGVEDAFPEFISRRGRET